MRISRAINTVASARGVSTEHADVVFEPQEQPQRIVVPQGMSATAKCLGCVCASSDGVTGGRELIRPGSHA